MRYRRQKNTAAANLRLPPDVLARVDAFADEREITRSAALRAVIYAGLRRVNELTVGVPNGRQKKSKESTAEGTSAA